MSAIGILHKHYLVDICDKFQVLNANRMGNEIFQKLKVQRSTSVVASTLSQLQLSFRVSGIADFVISRFVFANSIITFSITSFQNISDILRKTVIPPLNSDILFQSVILWIIKTHVQSYRVYTHIHHIICSRNMKLQVVFYIATHWQQC